MADLGEACDELRIPPGHEFFIAHPSAVTEEDPFRAPDAIDADAPPPHSTEGADRSAALDHLPRSGTTRHTVLCHLVDAGERGLTSDEIAARHDMNLYTVKPRLIELRQGGWAERNGRQRPSPRGSATDVYVATTKGRGALGDRPRPAALF